MQRVSVRFYAELNDFLPAGRRGRKLDASFHTLPTVKDLIEGLGVPHTEVDLVLVNGESAGFSSPLRDGDQVSVYPVFESIDISPILKVRPKPLREIRFVLDTHLGRLAAYLRMFGFDALYPKGADDATLASTSQHERRVLLTRDRELLKRRAVTHGYYVRQTAPRLQLVEVLERFDLAGSASPFTRCLECNGMLLPVDRESVLPDLEPRSAGLYHRFRRCESCRRIYWEGSHHRRMLDFVTRALNAVSSPRPSPPAQ